MITDKHITAGYELLEYIHFLKFEEPELLNIITDVNGDYINRRVIRAAAIMAELPTDCIRNGATRIAIIQPDVVYKTLYYGCGASNKSDWNIFKQEFKFLDKMRQSEYGRHFPETVLINHRGLYLQVQEAVRDVDSHLSSRLYSEVLTLADHLGIDDLHTENYGWKGPKGREWPVFFDVEFTSRPARGSKKKRRSWFV